MSARTRPNRLRFAFAAALLTLAVLPPFLLAHPVPRRCHDRVIVVRLTPTTAFVKYRLDVDYLTVVFDDLAAFGDEIDLSKVTTKEAVYEAFLRCYAPVLGQRLGARLD